MRAKITFLLFFAILTTIAGAQIIHEPNSDIYKDIDVWTVQGYIKSYLPLVHPYPLPLINQILNEVIETGDEKAKQRALDHLEKLEYSPIFTHPGVSAFAQGKNGDNEILGSIFTEGLFGINNLLNLSYHFAFYGMTDADMERLNIPGKYTPLADYFPDTSNLGGIKVDQNWTSLLSFGNSHTYLQAGLARSSFGPFFDNGVVAGPQAPRSGHFNFVYWQPKWSFEILFKIITAQDDFGKFNAPEKFNVIHSINIRPVKNVELGFIQSAVYGNRLELLYLIPFSYLFGSQAIFKGHDDNVFMGFHGRWRPADSFILKGLVYIDDFHLNDFISSGNIRAKAAAQAGISWAPKGSFFTKLDFDYTGVLPYMYTHWNMPRENRYIEGKTNYYNYTHMGKNMGVNLNPNSDRLSLKTYFNVIPSLDISLSGYFTRHGNASEKFIKNGIIEEENKKNHDGSILDDGLYIKEEDKDINPVKTSHLGYGFDLWLTQDILDIRLGGVIGIGWTLPIRPKFGTFKLLAEYCAEYGWNKELVKNNNGLDHYWSIGGKWSW